MTVALRSTCLKVSSLLVFMLFFQLGRTQYDFSGLNSKFPQLEKQAPNGNLAIMIYKDNKVVYNKASTDFPVNTQVHIGSAGKWMVAAMVLMLVDEGKISLDDKITKYLPIFQQYSKGYITLRHCLYNMTGIAGDDGEGINGDGKTLEDLVNSYAGTHEIETNAGTAYKYSNIGINIAARIVEVVTKRDFEQIIQQRLFRPLSMRATTFAFNYDKGISPANGGFSTAQDYLNFLSMLLNKGMFKGKPVMSEKAVNMLLQQPISASDIKNIPEAVKGMAYVPGAWVVEQDAAGKGTCFTSPGYTGVWPVLDLCRGYASVVFVKGYQLTEKRAIYTDVKAVADAQIQGGN